MHPLTAARGPVAASFVALGLFWGSWAVSIADVKRTFSLSDAVLGLLLAAAVAVAGLTGGVLGHYAERWGTRRVLGWSILAWAVCLAGAGAARTFPVFAVSFGAATVAGGCVDTAMNAASAARLMGRPGALVRFHALFNTGALGGAALAGVALHAGLSWRWLWPALGLAVVGLAVWTWAAADRHGTPASWHDPPAARPGRTGTDLGTPGAGVAAGPLARLRADHLALFLVIFAVAEVTEGGVDTWGVLFLRTQLAAGVLLGAGAYVVGQGVAALTRGAGGPALGRLSARSALFVGGTVAGGGILLESLAPRALAAAAGLALGAAGASLFWPLVMSEATMRASRPTAAVGAFTAAGYVGLVAGAPLVGWVADRWGLDRGLQLLAAMAFLVAATSIAGRIRAVRAARPG